MSIFIEYARYYNLLYQDKDYKKETAYVYSLIKRYSENNKKEMLDIGCGTGNHDFWFAKKGYRVVGIDRSPAMIDIARSKVSSGNSVEFYVYDAASFNFKKKFNIAISLFHVMSYQISNEVLYRIFRNVSNHLREKGIFIFDFWYGPAVLAEKPEVKVKYIHDKEISIERISKPSMRTNDNVVDIDFEILIRDMKNKVINKFKEKHSMRYFFLPELHYLLENAGFKVVTGLKWLSLKEGLDEKSWSGVLIAKK